MEAPESEKYYFDYSITEEQANAFESFGYGLDKMCMFQYNPDEIIEEVIATEITNAQDSHKQENMESAIDLTNENSVSDFLDDMIKDYEEKLVKESKYICESKFLLNSKHGNLSVAVGLSPARGFYPTIRLSGPRNVHISFLHVEWQTFLKQKDRIMKFYDSKFNKRCCTCLCSPKRRKLSNSTETNDDKEEKPLVNIFNDCNLLFASDSKPRLVQIRRKKCTISLNKKSFSILVEILPVIESKINFLQGLIFFNFYNQRLMEIIERFPSKDEVHVEDIYKLCLESIKNKELVKESVDCFLEIAVCQKSKLKSDLESMKNCIKFN